MRFALLATAALLLVPSVAHATYPVPPPKSPLVFLSHAPTSPVFQEKVQLIAYQLMAPGTIVFLDADVEIGRVVVNNEQAILETDKLATGTHQITAHYDGGTETAREAVAIAKATTKIELTQDVDTTAEKTVASFAVKVTADPGPIADGGEIVLQENDATLGSPATLKAGAATISLDALAPGEHRITALYKGTGDYEASASTAIAHTVTLSTGAAPPAGAHGESPSTSAAADGGPGGGNPVAPDSTAGDSPKCSAGAGVNAWSAWPIGLALVVANAISRRKRSRG